MTKVNYEKLYSAIKSDDQEYIESLKLEPNGVYQTVTTKLHELNVRVVDTLTRAFDGRDRDSFPHLAVSCGKCRVGSTALTNLFGIAGYPSYYQPVKTILRFETLGQRGAPWNVPEASQTPLVHCKEMTGPYSLAECLFDPIDLLINAGYPSEKITLIALDRAPLDSLDSWISKWHTKLDVDTLVKHYVLSALNAKRIIERASKHNVKTINYVYEASKSPHEAVAGLLEQFNLGDQYSPDMVDDWGNRGSLESADSMVKFPVEPDPYVVVGLHGSETKYMFKPRTTENVTEEMKILLEEHGILDGYNNAKNICFKHLKIREIA